VLVSIAEVVFAGVDRLVVQSEHIYTRSPTLYSRGIKGLRAELDDPLDLERNN
jgi:hypothetical protein